MKRTLSLLTAALAALPLVVVAQTANTPGGQAATGTPLDQTKDAPQQTTPKTTRTTPDTTNPSGSLPSKAPSSTSTKRASQREGAKEQSGDAPTYPAPAPSGQPTK